MEFVLRSSRDSDTASFAIPPGLPDEINGQPVKYLWKRMIRQGQYRHPTHGWNMAVTPERMSKWRDNFARMKERGIRVFLPEKHKDYDANSNFGWLIDVKTEGDSLWGLHQLIGEDAIRAASRNDSSICIKSNYQDSQGNVYDEVIEHNALCPDPVAAGLGDFIAMSHSGRELVMPVYMAEQGEQNMPLPKEQLDKVRQLVGDNNITDEQAVPKLLELIQSRDQKVQSLEGEKQQVLSRATTAESKVSELSRSAQRNDAPIDPMTLSLAADNRRMKLDGLVSRGRITTNTRQKLEKLFVGDGNQQALELSIKSGSHKQFDDLVSVLDENDPVELNKHRTGSQAVAMQRTVPGNDGEDQDEKLDEQGRKDAESFLKFRQPVTR